MPVDQEPNVKRIVLPIRNSWNTSQITGHAVVSSGPLPTPEQLHPVDPKTGKSVDIQSDFLSQVAGDNNKD